VTEPHPTLIRAILNVWKARGWVDADDAAVGVARRVASGASEGEAAKAVSGAFLDRNKTSRRDVSAALAGIAHHSRPEFAVESCGRVVVLTAIPSEYKAVVEQLRDRQSRVAANGTRYEFGTTDGQGCVWEVAVAQIGPGNIGAAAEVTSAAAEYDPDLFLFVGVAGGLSDDVPHGTVVVANKVYYYEPGKAEANTWLARPVSFHTPHRLTQLAMSVARDWDEALVLVKPIAAGEALVASQESDVAKIVRAHYNDSVAVDMESAGLYEAAYRAERPSLAIRGISDRLDDKSVKSDATHQPQAARNAARLAVALLGAANRRDVTGKDPHGTT
jgi:nucleoside phosphorylase